MNYYWSYAQLCRVAAEYTLFPHRSVDDACQHATAMMDRGITASPMLGKMSEKEAIERVYVYVGRLAEPPVDRSTLKRDNSKWKRLGAYSWKSGIRK